MHVKKGDLVQMISGAEKGKQGRVIKVDPKRGMIKVEGFRVATRHIKPTAQKGGSIEKREAYFPACKVLPVDPTTGKPTRVRIQVVNDKKVRVAVKSGANIEQARES